MRSLIPRLKYWQTNENTLMPFQIMELWLIVAAPLLSVALSSGERVTFDLFQDMAGTEEKSSRCVHQENDFRAEGFDWSKLKVRKNRNVDFQFYERCCFRDWGRCQSVQRNTSIWPYLSKCHWVEYLKEYLSTYMSQVYLSRWARHSCHNKHHSH